MKKRRTYGTTEVAEKYSVSSKRVDNFHPETPSPLVGEGWGEGDENKMHLNSKPVSPPPWPSPIKGEGKNMGFRMKTR